MKNRSKTAIVAPLFPELTNPMAAPSPRKILVTSALPYANGPIHLGHLAGAYLPADVYTRHLRLLGEKVIHISGSDEHGVPITIRAKKEGITPQQIVDKYHELNKKSFEDYPYLLVVKGGKIKEEDLRFILLSSAEKHSLRMKNNSQSSSEIISSSDRPVL